MTATGKLVVARYYGKPETKAYTRAAPPADARA